MDAAANGTLGRPLHERRCGESAPTKRKVAVGIMVTHNPLHRSRRAALPHRAPALGDDAEASPRIRVADTRGRKPAVHVAMEPLHREAMFLAAAAERATPQPPHGLTEGDDGPAVQQQDAAVVDRPTPYAHDPRGNCREQRSLRGPPIKAASVNSGLYRDYAPDRGRDSQPFGAHDADVPGHQIPTFG